MSAPSLPLTSRYDRAMAPLTIRGVTFRNRVVLASMGLDMAEDDGRMSPRLVEFYRGIMAGGAGAIVLSNASVSPNTALFPRALKLFNDDHVAALAPLMQEAAEQDVVVGVQLQHYGGQGMTHCTPTDVLLTPSGIRSALTGPIDPARRFRAMDGDDIANVVAEFAQAAARARQAGARFIQIQAANGYLLSSFLSKATNRREDAYGGSPERRARLLIEVVRAVRAAIGEDAVLGLRLGIDDRLGPAGMEPADITPVIPDLEAAGVDLFEISFCVAETFQALAQNTPEVRRLMAAQVKDFRSRARRPVGFAGFIGGLAEGCRLIDAGVIDYIPMARALLADNDLVRKEVSGREDEVHRCLWDGQCFKDRYTPNFDRVRCCVNPKYLRSAPASAA